MRVAGLGHRLFAVTMIALGFMGLVRSDYAALWYSVPAAVPAHRALGYVCALLSIFCGAGLFWPRFVALSSRVLLLYLIVWSLLVGRAGISDGLTAFGSWYGFVESVAMVAAAWLLYAWFATGWEQQHLSFATGITGVRIARVLFALTLLYFGMGHLVFVKETASDVPAWLPWHVAWAHFTGYAFILAGLALLTGWGHGWQQC